MAAAAASPAAALPDRWLTDWERSGRMPFYTRANAGEVLADPASPLGWTLVFEHGLLPGWLRGLVEFGIYREGELPMERPPVAGLFGGYFYINLSHCRVVAIRMGMTVEAFDAALLGSAAAAPPYQPHPDDPCDECSAKVAQTIGEILAASRFPQIDADLDRVLAKRRDRPDLAALSEADLVAHARSFLPELDNAFARHDYSTFGSAVGPAMLAEACAAAGEPAALLDLISGYGEVPSASPSWGLWQLSRLANASPELARCSTGARRRSRRLAAPAAGQVRRGPRRLPGRLRPARPERVGHPRHLLGGGAGPGARAGRQHAAHARRGFAGRPARPAGSHPPGRRRADPCRPARRRRAGRASTSPCRPRPGPSRCARRPS